MVLFFSLQFFVLLKHCREQLLDGSIGIVKVLNYQMPREG